MYYKQIVLISIAFAVVVGCADLGRQASPDKKSRQRTAEVDRGRYLVEIMGCNDCHTPSYMADYSQIPEENWLVGGDLGFHGSWGTAYPTNLRLMLSSMAEEKWLLLAKKMRRDSPMAWVMLSKVTDQDLRAIYRFINYLGPKGEPAPKRLPAGVKPKTDFLEFPEPH